MPSPPRLRESVLRAREQLAADRDRLRAQHESGSPGVQVCALLTEMLDRVVLGLYQAVLADLPQGEAAVPNNEIALVALGGYGRRDVAPFSDVDLMVLFPRGTEKQAAPLARQLMMDICDTNLDLGHSLRTPEEALSLASSDSTIFTSLVEARLVAGSESLFERFVARFRRQAQRNYARLLPLIEHSRQEERDQFGESVFMLEPNLKRSRGGLRDIQLLRWVGLARYGEREPDGLALAGFLPKSDEEALRAARDFLLRLRNELHFHRGKSYDVLDKGEQVRIAEKFGYGGTEAVLPVENLMREYFEHTSTVRTVVANFLEGARPAAGWRAMIGSLFNVTIEGDFRVSPYAISATRRGMEKIKSGDVAEVLRMMELAALSNRRIDYAAWRAIREAMQAQHRFEITPAVSSRFLSLLDQPARLAELLRRLHELRVLEKIVPGVAHARNLMQFNEYHKYTVDEHSLRVVECATEFARRSDTLGEVYRSIKHKRTLHLACLIHDLGKGFVEDHSEVGARLADEASQRLGLPPAEAESLRFLVHKHLSMTHLALWRDISDEAVVVKFAVEVGSPEMLQMLYVLSCADLAGVGPGVLNDWKLDFLTSLYLRAMHHLAGDASASFDERLEARRAVVQKLLKPDSEAWKQQQVAALPAAYLYGSPPEKIVAELDRLQALPHHDAVAWARLLPQQSAVEYTVGTYEEIVPGIFHRLTGALTSQGHSILSAEIHTLSDNLVLDRFYVLDGDFSGPPPSERQDAVCRSLVQALKQPQTGPPAFRKRWGETPAAAEAARLPAQVRIDNNTSERFTIIDVFAHDQMGLLYAITRTLFELGLSVGGAKIGTHLDQVVDVFYVVDQSGQKIPDARFDEIRSRVLAAIAQLTPQAASATA